MLEETMVKNERTRIIGNAVILEYDEIKYNIEILNLALQIIELKAKCDFLLDRFNVIYGEFLNVIDFDFDLSNEFDDIIDQMNDYLNSSKVYNEFISNNKKSGIPYKVVRNFAFHIPNNGDIPEIRDVVRAANLAEISAIIINLRSNINELISMSYNNLLNTKILTPYFFANEKKSNYEFLDYKKNDDYIDDVEGIKNELEKIYLEGKISNISFEISKELIDVLLENYIIGNKVVFNKKVK